MEQNKYKILVLSDLKDTTNSTLKSAVSIAQMTNADINFFHVKKPADVVKKESQLSAMRTLNKEYNSINRKIQNLITPISKEHGIAIDYKFSFGNVKNEIDQHIKETQPDIIILGKKKTSLLNIIGDNLTSFILKNNDSTIFFADSNNSLEPNKPIALGLLNNEKDSLEKSIVKNFLNNISKPIVSFNIAKKNNTINGIDNSSSSTSINYVFDQNDNTIKNLSSYLLKNNIHILHINRSKDDNSLTKSDINKAINTLKTSLLITSI
ncbi:conserved hypothetical protein [Tenacibaculum sediminilitoris]|uniref:universal stress protein n=1 Tax=Tenacibaculum sediminilitoris TaxID=1820334 RepID=UPI0038941614